MPQRPCAGRRSPHTSSDHIAELYDRHAAGLYRYAVMVLADHGLAEDAVQQVFSKLLSSNAANQLELPTHYLRRALRNECYSMLLHQRLRRDERPLLETTRDRVDSEQRTVTDRWSIEERLVLEAALCELSAEQREVLTLKVHEGFTFKEIAALVGAPQNTVASRYRYALEKLRTLLDTPSRVAR